MPRSAREWVTVLWPAFVAACLLEMVVFAAFDPHDFMVFGWQVEPDHRDAVYSLAFLIFWVVTTAAGIITWTLARPGEALLRETSTPGVPSPSHPPRDLA